jgi:serine phosphatase RsbU (regulator of sigma subunit)
MTERAGGREPATGPSEDLLARLSRQLGLAFDLAAPIGDTTLGALVEHRLRDLQPDEPPEWGGEGEIAQVARRHSGPLDFYYRPHLFPDMDRALRLGHLLQFDLLPRSAPLESPLRIAAVLESYCHLSGDLLGWRMEEDELFVWIADVSGHGIRAGLAAAVLCFLVGAIEPGLAPGEFVARLHRSMRRARNPADRSPLFATGFWLRVGPDGRARYASSGHPPTLRCRTGGAVELLGSTGPPIGLLEEASCETVDFRLEPRDRLCLFTDGVTEAVGRQGEEFAVEGLATVLQSVQGTPFDAIRAIYDAVAEHRDTSLLDDDLTFMVVERR